MVNESKEKVCDLKMKLLEEASDAAFWSDICLSATLIATTAKMCVATALGATVPILLMPFALIVGGSFSALYAADAWKKYATSEQLG